MPLPGVSPWDDPDIVLYHGTLEIHVSSVMRGIDLGLCGGLKDFGRGFYTTTSQRLATRWANDLANLAGGVPAVISFTVERNRLAGLDCLVFIRGDSLAFDYWGFVEHCRTTVQDHNRKHAPWYGMVAGPVTGSWKKQSVIPGSDQFSFHTADATRRLDESVKARVS